MADAGLQCRELTFHRSDGLMILKNVSVCFSPGQPALITGPTGAGKSTLLHLLGGLLRPSSGEVWAANEAVSRWNAPHRDKWRRQVGLLFQHLHLMGDLSVLENVLLPCVPHTVNWGDLTDRAVTLLDGLDLASLKHAPLHSLSGGQRQRVALARALIARPRYLLLDEPTAFQDDVHTRRFLDICSAAAGEGGCLVVCSHDHRLLKRRTVFDKVYALDQAQLRERS